MEQLKRFIPKGEAHRVCKLQHSIYGLKQAPLSWNIKFEEFIQGYDFELNLDE